MKGLPYLIICLLWIAPGCRKKTPVVNCSDNGFFEAQTARSFKMGFTTWIFAAEQAARQSTYDFIGTHSDIYSEQIDDKIPWQALISNQPLPQTFTNDIAQRVSLRPPNKKLLLSVSLLNINRTGLLEDMDGTVPGYSMSDPVVADAYFRLLVYLVGQFHPDYLVLAMEVNELLVRDPAQWEGYKTLIAAVKSRLKSAYPLLPLSESVTLHNWFRPDVSNVATYQAEINTYVNSLDFAAISFYPFLKNQHNKEEFQQAFDFLHNKVSIPIAFTETAHIAEPLTVHAFNISMNGSECEQNSYLETLLTNAQANNYLFLIWWSHRDYDQLWAIFPEHTKDIGLLWRDTGIIDENGRERPAFHTWNKVHAR